MAVRTMTRAVTVVGGVRMNSNSWTIVRLNRIDIDFRQPVVSMTIVSVEWERLEHLEHSFESNLGRSFVVREPELVSANWLDVVQFVVSSA